jgi:uncharacterized protein (DUF983 family)
MLGCANCGERAIFRRWFSMAESCPNYRLKFERMPGYWLGAMILNFAVTAAAILITIAASAAVTWPDPPWTAI